MSTRTVSKEELSVNSIDADEEDLSRTSSTRQESIHRPPPEPERVISCLVSSGIGIGSPSFIRFSRGADGLVCLCFTLSIAPDGSISEMIPETLVLPLIYLTSADTSESSPPSVRLRFEAGFSLTLLFRTPDALTEFSTTLQNNSIERSVDRAVAADPTAVLLFRLTGEGRAGRRPAAPTGLQAVDPATGSLGGAFDRWVGGASECVVGLVAADRDRWSLHAKASLDLDLQAWYHDSFNDEIFCLKVKFWVRDSSLPPYKLSNKLIANKLTKYEEAALAHVLCTPDTTYGDVASHMFVIQSMLPPALYRLFEDICSKGITVVKFPRSGSPAKKLFRFSFVEGSIYFTWKGQYGNQGVDLAEVSSVVSGLQSDILRRSGRRDKEALYLSLLCAERSVDLLCASVEERESLAMVLAAIVQKEKRAALVSRTTTPTSTLQRAESGR